MPLSKKRMRERKKQDRANVKPNIVVTRDYGTFECGAPNFSREAMALVKPKQPWEVTDWANYKGPIMPLPNCPDGRYRE